VIISSAPLRVTFAGGGSDYKSFYERNGGAVFGAAIRHRVYVFINELSIFSDENVRFTYRLTESVLTVDQIEHPVVREALKYFKISNHINIATMADLPGKSGLGSSSAFTVALVAGLARYVGRELSLEEIIQTSYFIEREVLKEPGGIQDHLHATYGGFRLYKFDAAGFHPSLPIASPAASNFFEENLLLCRLGGPRTSASAAARTEQATASEEKQRNLAMSAELARAAYQKLGTDPTTKDLMKTLVPSVNSAWQQKISFQSVSDLNLTEEIDYWMTQGAGAVKLCGAGESGFLLIIGSKTFITKLRTTSNSKSFLNIQLSTTGLKVDVLN
jgi:D-glycero-alpha-D-manno-heptose-7-phosphate kinase